MNGPNVYIAIPTYSGNPWYKNTESLLGTFLCLKELGWDCRVNYIAGDPILPSVRNKFVADFMASGCSHLFFIDDDVAWTPKGFVNMVRAGKEVISGMVPIRQADGYAVVENGEADGDLVGLDYIGAAFLCIARDAILRMIEFYPGLRCRTYDSMGDYGYSFFDYEIMDEYLQGEDITFCRRWNKIGKIWGYPGIDFKHKSVKVIEGNYEQDKCNADNP